MHSQSEMKEEEKFNKIFWSLVVVVVVEYCDPIDRFWFDFIAFQ